MGTRIRNRSQGLPWRWHADVARSCPAAQGQRTRERTTQQHISISEQYWLVAAVHW